MVCGDVAYCGVVQCGVVWRGVVMVMAAWFGLNTSEMNDRMTMNEPFYLWAKTSVDRRTSLTLGLQLLNLQLQGLVAAPQTFVLLLELLHKMGLGTVWLKLQLQPLCGCKRNLRFGLQKR